MSRAAASRAASAGSWQSRAAADSCEQQRGDAAAPSNRAARARARHAHGRRRRSPPRRARACARDRPRVRRAAMLNIVPDAQHVRIGHRRARRHARRSRRARRARQRLRDRESGRSAMHDSARGEATTAAAASEPRDSRRRAGRCNHAREQQRDDDAGSRRRAWRRAARAARRGECSAVTPMHDGRRDGAGRSSKPAVLT